VAVVGEEQLDRGIGCDGVHGATNDVERGFVVVAHLERPRQAGLELSARRIGPHRALLGGLLAARLHRPALSHPGHAEEQREDQHAGDGSAGERPLGARQLGEQLLGEHDADERRQQHEADPADARPARGRPDALACLRPVAIGDPDRRLLLTHTPL